MSESIDVVLQGKNQTDAAFKAVERNQDKLQADLKQTNDLMARLSGDAMGKLDGAMSGLAGNAGGLGSTLGALGPVGMAAAAGIGAIIAVATGVEKAVVAATMAAADYADKLDGLSAKTGLTGETLQKLDVAAKLGNSSLEQVAGSVNKMQLALAKGSDGFRQLGLDVEHLKQLSPDEQFAEVSKALLAVTDQTDRAEVGSKILGKSWGDLIGTMQAMASGASDLGGALSDDALAASAELKDKTDLMSEAWDRAVRQFGAAIAQSPEVQRAISDITDIIVASAQKIAEWAPTIARVFDAGVLEVRKAMAAVEAATRSGLVGGYQAWLEYKQKVEQLELDALFSDVVGGGTTGPKVKPPMGPSDADLARYKKAEDAARKLAEAENKAREKVADQWDKFFKTLFKEESDLTSWVQKEAKARTDAIVKGFIEEQAERHANLEASRRSYEEMSKAMLDAQRHSFDGLASGLGQAADLLDMFGVSADSALGSIVNLAAGTADMLAQAAQRGYITLSDLANQAAQIYKQGSAGAGALSGAMTGFAIGGPIGAGIGAIAGGILGWAGGAAKARAEMEKLRNEFVKSAGGMAALQTQAKAAGVSLDGMFKQKNATALAHQIDSIKAKLAEWADAQDILKTGSEKWGIAVADMGKGYASLDLDARAKEMVLFFAAATGSGANMSAVTTGMAKDVLALVGQYKAAGLEIPEALKPVLQAMLEQGKLVDENGKAYGSFEEAGITFGKSMTGVLAGIETAVDRLMRVLAQGFHIPLNFDVNGAPSGGASAGGVGGPTGGGGGHHPPANEDVPMAAGGILTRPTRVLAAEAGNPEAFIPLTRETYAALGAGIAQAMTAHGGGGMAGGGVVVHNHVSLGNRVWSEASQATRRREFRVQPSALRRF